MWPGCTVPGCGRPFSATAEVATLTELDGRLHLDFVGTEVELLRNLLVRVSDLLAEDADPATGAPADPVLARLLPDAHRDDPVVAATQRELTEAGLREDKRADIGAVMAALPAETGSAVIVDPDAWLRALNDMRLMLGVELGITEDTEPPRSVSDPRELQLAVYFWLTHLQDRLVEAVLG
ncbi:MAG: DUF2017 domain-containing protein [Geodermatophilaceae bacterium]|nr:DUF2017 domain-containing protein [Geodermatophilaceae bacterium]